MNSPFTASASSRPLTVPNVCCFDFDGLLVDTSALWARAFAAACAAAGGTVSKINIGALQGASVPSASAELTRQTGVDVSDEALSRALDEAFHATPPRVLPGARRLLELLARSTRMVVVTNGPAALVQESLTRANLDHHFTGVISAEEVARPKPAPDVYLAACQRMGVHPADAVAFEDSLVGVRAAQAAGLRVVIVPDQTTPDGQLIVDRLDDSRVLGFLGMD